MKFADIRNDIAFRKIFGNEHKTIILLSFLNAVLNLKQGRRIMEVTIQNPYQLPIIQNLKASIIDVRATDEQGKTYLIEMQVSDPVGLDKRVLYYASKEYSQQIARGEEYPDLRPVIFIGIFDFKFTQSEHYLSHHVVSDVQTGEQVIKDMDFYFIELPKFGVPVSSLNGVIEQWIYFLKEAQHLEFIPESVTDEGLITAYADANQHTWSKLELKEYDYVSMRAGDAKGAVTKAHDTGLAEGIQQGKEAKEKEAVVEMELNGVPVAMIARYLKMTEARVREILGQIDEP